MYTILYVYSTLMTQNHITEIIMIYRTLPGQAAHGVSHRVFYWYIYLLARLLKTVLQIHICTVQPFRICLSYNLYKCYSLHHVHGSRFIMFMQIIVLMNTELYINIYNMVINIIDYMLTMYLQQCC